MKKTDLLKAGLATITMMVLSACGGGGGGDTPTTASTNTTNTPSATDKGSADKAADDKAAADKAAAEAAKQAEETAKKAEEERLAKEAAAKEAQMKEEAAKKAAEELAKAKQEAEDAKKALAEAEKAKAEEKAAAEQAAKETAAQLAAAQEAALKAANAATEALKQLEAKLQAEKDAAAQAEKDRLAAEQAEKDRLAAEQAAQDAANKAVLVDTKPVNIGKSHVGYLHTKKDSSDFDVQGTGSSVVDDKANTAVLMRDRDNFNHHLDNLVIAHDGDKIVYLEDLDLRTAKLLYSNKVDEDGKPIPLDYSYAIDTTSNKLYNAVKLHNVYLDNQRIDRSKGTFHPFDSDDDNPNNDGYANDPLRDRTKKETQGTFEATALVYQNGRKIYIDNNDLKGIRAVTLTSEGRVNPNGGDAFEDNGELANGIEREGTIFEIYGHKTVDYWFKPKDGSKEVANLPLSDESLNHVQYGRATSQLSGKELDDFTKGLKANSWIAQYGTYNSEGTENHYFARGVNNTTAEQVAALPQHYSNNKLTYEGHAVAYGLDNKYRNPNGRVDGIPTALINAAPESFLVSGNHIRANVDLNTKLVDGDVYNVWAIIEEDANSTKPPKVETPLVGFKGMLADNGNIAGDAVNFSRGNAPGIFNATLYGEKAEEMGGTIVSAKPDESDWGLSFGAKIVTKPKDAPATPAAPNVKPVEVKTFRPASDKNDKL